MNNRRKLIVALGAGALAGPLRSFAQQQGKPVRAGILVESSATGYQLQEKILSDAMRERGWVEGGNIVYDRVYAEGDLLRLPALAAELIARSPNLIFAFTGSDARAALARTRTIPIVMTSANDPVAGGLVKSLAHPGGNVTGMANIGYELGGKRMQFLKQALPKVTRVGVLVNPVSQDGLRELKLIEHAAATLGVTVTPAMVKTPTEFDSGFALLANHRVEAVLTTHTAIFLDNRKRILDLAAVRRMAVVGHRGQLADEGALMSYSAVLADQIRRAAQIADKILKGAKPADIPVEQPTKFELVVNMKTAKTLGITIPGEILLQAIRVIE